MSEYTTLKKKEKKKEFFFFWINKNLFPNGQNPTKNTHEVKKTPKKNEKTDSTSPKTEEKGHQPETKIHLINGRQSPTYGHNQHKQPIKPPAPNTHIRAQPTKQPSKPHSPGKQTKIETSPHPGHRKIQPKTAQRPSQHHKSSNQPTMR